MKGCLRRHNFQQCTKAFCKQKCGNDKESDFCRSVCGHHLAFFQVNEDLPGPNFLQVASDKAEQEPHEHLSSKIAGDTDFKAVSAMARSMREGMKGCLRRHNFRQCTEAFCKQKCGNDKESDFCRSVCGHHLALFQVNEDLPGPNFLQLASADDASPDLQQDDAEEETADSDAVSAAATDATSAKEGEEEGLAEETDADAGGEKEAEDEEEEEEASTGQAADAANFLQRRRA